ncbi:hypothetical protein AGMMS49573_00670 [Endomicrobiia bacterium]|nr:hypothetical protein AGMMS49573_00670 [Endomicrobiia bacterium]
MKLGSLRWKEKHGYKEITDKEEIVERLSAKLKKKHNYQDRGTSHNKDKLLGRIKSKLGLPEITYFDYDDKSFECAEDGVYDQLSGLDGKINPCCVSKDHYYVKRVDGWDCFEKDGEMYCFIAGGGEINKSEIISDYQTPELNVLSAGYVQQKHYYDELNGLYGRRSPICVPKNYDYAKRVE